MQLGRLRTLVTAPRPASWPDVRVMCVWLPQLQLRVEVLRHPEWDGLPLVLGGAPGERKVVHLCSPEAERAGITPGMPLREVVPLCRDAIVLQPDPVRTAAVLEEVLAALQQVSPLVEVDESGYLFLELGGLRALYEDDFRRLEAAIRDGVPMLLRPRMGAGSGKFAAAVAARVAPVTEARVVPARQTRDFLKPLPIALLPFPPDVMERLELLGLRTVGDFAKLPFAAAQAQFGTLGAHAWQLAHGRDT